MMEAKNAILTGAPSGHFILSTGCEIPTITPDENLMAIPAAIKRYGRHVSHDFEAEKLHEKSVEKKIAAMLGLGQAAVPDP